jgi:Acyl-CoA dehydrogenase, C-terminal domain
MDPAERALLETTVGDAVANAEPGVPADNVLARLGWREMLAAEPRDATAIVFEALGAAGATASVLDDVVAAALGLQPSEDVAVLFPPFASWEPPGRQDGSRVCATGLATGRVAAGTELLVACGGTDPGLASVPRSAARIAPVRGLDPDGRSYLVEVDHEGAAAPLAPDAWLAAVAAGRRAIAHQIAGACHTMLELARTHAREREQFGRPVARFQAVQHRLADALVAIEALDATLVVAWDEPGPTTAALAKAVAGRTARAVGAQCQQILAGTGFTTEHPFHRFLKRTMTLDGIFGTGDQLTVALGRELLAARRVPTLIEL